MFLKNDNVYELLMNVNVFSKVIRLRKARVCCVNWSSNYNSIWYNCIYWTVQFIIILMQIYYKFPCAKHAIIPNAVSLIGFYWNHKPLACGRRLGEGREKLSWRKFLRNVIIVIIVIWCLTLCLIAFNCSTVEFIKNSSNLKVCFSRQWKCALLTFKVEHML